MYGLGIDTGGTYTDAVIYDFAGEHVLTSAKSLTTRDDLSKGILGALSQLDEQYLSGIEIVSLSTTLATNACVEDKGGRAKLIFIGVDRRIVQDVGASYGLPPVHEMYFLDYLGRISGDIITHPDWELFEREIPDYLADADSVGIVDLFSMKNGGILEKRAAEFVKTIFDRPLICGYELFDDLNSVKRGSSTMLNARLIPIISEFVSAIKHSLKQYNINAPIVLVRSDGSLMSEQFSTLRPVETLLCGPCASVMGGVALSKEDNCIIVDMGGTTTDISIVRGGIPVKSTDGINIGKWRTYVKGIYTDTFGLGGDSAVRYDSNGHLTLEARRIVPLSILAANYSEVVNKLKLLCESEIIHTRPLHEFFCLQKDITGNPAYSDAEREFCEALKQSPLIYTDAADAAKTDVYRLNFARLENEGVIIRAGLTPTDIMCVTGDYTGLDPAAAIYTAEYVARCTGYGTSKILCAEVYDRIKKKIYTNILRILWEQEHPDMAKKGLSADILELFAESWDNKTSMYSANFALPLSVIGIGAPIHIFLPDVSARLGAKCIIPPNAPVANAIGAVMGNVTVNCDIIVKPVYSPDGIVVFGKSATQFFEEMTPAVEFARVEAESYVRSEALRRGAVGDLTVTIGERDNSASLKGNQEILLNSVVSATAVGRISTIF